MLKFLGCLLIPCLFGVCFAEEKTSDVKIAKEVIYVVVFSKENCIPCGKMKIALNKLGVNYNVYKYVRDDQICIDLKVDTVPTLIVYKNDGKETVEVGRAVGFYSTDDLQKKLIIFGVSIISFEKYQK